MVDLQRCERRGTAIMGYTGIDDLAGTIRRCRNQDVKAMETVYNGYQSSIYNIALRFFGDHGIAEDIMQEVFIKVFGRLHKLHAVDAFQSWLHRIAVNTCINHHQKIKRSREVPMETLVEQPASDNPPRMLTWDLVRAVHILPPKQKMVFILHDIQGFTHSEIAEMMNWSVGTCKSQLFKARVKLQNFLKE
jgi:RNA polymerase sigma-70 factor, ECF subfamily